MAKKSSNSSLTEAKSARYDEYYTQFSDIEKELKHYKQHFKGKVVFCCLQQVRSAHAGRTHCVWHNGGVNLMLEVS